MIDDVSIWNAALSQDQIRKLMFDRLGGKEAGTWYIKRFDLLGLVGYWSFNEGEGSKTVDHTPNRFDGDVYSARWVPSEKKDLILNDCV